MDWSCLDCPYLNDGGVHNIGYLKGGRMNRAEMIDKVAEILRSSPPATCIGMATDLVDNGVRTKEGFVIKDRPHTADRGYDVWIEPIDFGGEDE